MTMLLFIFISVVGIISAHWYIWLRMQNIYRNLAKTTKTYSLIILIKFFGIMTLLSCFVFMSYLALFFFSIFYKEWDFIEYFAFTLASIWFFLMILVPNYLKISYVFKLQKYYSYAVFSVLFTLIYLMFVYYFFRQSNQGLITLRVNQAMFIFLFFRLIFESLFLFLINKKNLAMLSAMWIFSAFGLWYLPYSDLWNLNWERIQSMPSKIIIFYSIIDFLIALFLMLSTSNFWQEYQKTKGIKSKLSSF